MTLEEAKQALKEGKKVYHRFFVNGEYIYMNGKFIYDESDNILGTFYDFFNVRNTESWKIDWDIWID
jgi:hypothetical protein